MDNNKYSLLVGIVLLIGSITFFIIPSLFDYDAFIPVMMSIFSLLAAVAFFFIGLSGKSGK